MRYHFDCSVTLDADDLDVTLKLGNASRRLLITVPPLPLRLTVIPTIVVVVGNTLDLKQVETGTLASAIK